jgi:hypothetical protein
LPYFNFFLIALELSVTPSNPSRRILSINSVTPSSESSEYLSDVRISTQSVTEECGFSPSRVARIDFASRNLWAYLDISKDMPERGVVEFRERGRTVFVLAADK